MLPLRVSAMESFFGKKQEQGAGNSARAAAVLQREREATDPRQSNPRDFTSSAVAQSDNTLGMGGIRIAPKEGGVQRDQIAALLNQASEKEESIADIEQEAIDDSARNIDTIAHQVPSSRIRAEQALQALQNENRLHQEAMDTFIRLMRTTKESGTMAALKIFDFENMTDIGGSVWSNNQGFDWKNAVLILNNDPINPVELCIPAVNQENRSASIIPQIIPSGVRTNVNGVTFNAPVRQPTPEENLQIRKLIKEAFDCYYGPENRERWLPKLNTTDDPVKAEELAHAFSEADRLVNESNSNPEQPQEIQAVLLLNSDETKRREVEAFFNRANESLTTSHHKLLAQAAWHAGETMARGAGVLGKTVADVSLSRVGPGALAGATTGASLAIGYYAFHPLNNVQERLEFVAVGSSLIGYGVAGAFGLDSREANQAVIAGSLLSVAAALFFPHASLLATAVRMSSAGALGGALPFAGDLVHAAQGAWNHYAPGVAFEKAKEALGDMSWTNINHTLGLMQQGQQIDLEAMQALHNFFDENFLHLEQSSAGSEMSGEAMSPTRVREILIGQIKLRILYREDFINRLQSKIADIKKRELPTEKESQAIFNSTDFRRRYPRGL